MTRVVKTVALNHCRSPGHQISTVEPLGYGFSTSSSVVDGAGAFVTRNVRSSTVSHWMMPSSSNSHRASVTCCRGWTCCRGAAFQTCLVFRIWATYHVSSDANHTSMREPVNSSTGKTPVSTSFSRIAEHAEHGSCMPVSHEATGRARAHLRRPLIVPARAQAVCGTGPVAATLHGRPDAAESRSLRANACRVHATRSLMLHAPLRLSTGRRAR